jgi:hypothetical protein
VTNIAGSKKVEAREEGEKRKYWKTIQKDKVIQGD